MRLLGEVIPFPFLTLRIGNLLTTIADLQLEAWMIVPWMPVIEMPEGILRCFPSTQNSTGTVYCTCFSVSIPGKAADPAFACPVPNVNSPQPGIVLLCFNIFRIICNLHFALGKIINKNR